MQINKPATEKMKNEGEEAGGLIFEALFKLGRNKQMVFLLMNRQ